MAATSINHKLKASETMYYLHVLVRSGHRVLSNPVRRIMYTLPEALALVEWKGGKS